MVARPFARGLESVKEATSAFVLPDNAPGKTLTCRIPSAHNDPPIRRVVLDLVDDLSQLIHALTRIVVLARLVRRAEMPPLKSVHRTQIPHPPMREPDPIEVLPRPISDRKSVV